MARSNHLRPLLVIGQFLTLLTLTCLQSSLFAALTPLPRPWRRVALLKLSLSLAGHQLDARAYEPLTVLAEVESFPSLEKILPLYGIFDLAFESCKRYQLRHKLAEISDLEFEKYALACADYAGEIRYEDASVEAERDRSDRYKRCADGIAALERASKLLRNEASVGTAAVQTAVIQGVTYLGEFFALLPNEDVAEARTRAQQSRAFD
eukprot:TRINITY_DN79522_c0_g1_i1.p1 TRINITY_DN79522_c0_g1~~TRINITY_DN79522_c0_g1_i1.p1  ORF type:complete len:208 (+),score=29.24 TRINITY_DN79522_c0_g1_i1:60-683(+)